jgi:peptidoglycan/LPS O-acetylase OafA/YrhL
VLLAGSIFIHGARYWKDGIPCALIVLGAVSLAPACSGPLGRFLTRLGDASYSIYLFQVFALPACALVLRVALTASRVGALPAWSEIAALWVAACGAGYLCWRYIEDPMTRYLRTWTWRPALSSSSVV